MFSEKIWSILTGSLLFLLLLLFLFHIICLSIKIIVGIFGKLPFIVLVTQVRCSASEIHVELLDVNLHNAAVHSHANLTAEKQTKVSVHRTFSTSVSFVRLHIWGVYCFINERQIEYRKEIWDLLTLTLSSGCFTHLVTKKLCRMKPVTALSNRVLTPMAWPGQEPLSKWFHT